MTALIAALVSAMVFRSEERQDVHLAKTRDIYPLGTAKSSTRDELIAYCTHRIDSTSSKAKQNLIWKPTISIHIEAQTMVQNFRASRPRLLLSPPRRVRTMIHRLFFITCDALVFKLLYGGDDIAWMNQPRHVLRPSILLSHRLITVETQLANVNLHRSCRPYSVMS